MVEKISIPYWEIEQLVCHLVGIDYKQDYENIEEALYNAYDISFDDFHNLIEALVPMIDISLSTSTDEMYKGFAIDKNLIIKTKVK